MLVIDTNILIYAADADSPYHPSCRDLIDRMRVDPSPAYLSWNICYEFLRVCTHIRAPVKPWSLDQAWKFLSVLLTSPGFRLLKPTDRHAEVLRLTVEELPDLRGNICHDLHTAVLMRENGVSQICTRDTDFHRFPFLTVLDPSR